jgi:hypothetical protein
VTYPENDGGILGPEPAPEYYGWASGRFSDWDAAVMNGFARVLGEALRVIGEQIALAALTGLVGNALKWVGTVLRWIPAIARLIKWGDEWVDLYRAVSAAELADIEAYGGFRNAPGFYETAKGFWLREESAREWYAKTGWYDAIVRTSVRKSTLRQPGVEYIPNLDGVGDAVYIPSELLPTLGPAVRLPTIRPG